MRAGRTWMSTEVVSDEGRRPLPLGFLLSIHSIISFQTFS